MNYKVKAMKISMQGSNTTLEDYEKDVPNYAEAEKERIRLKSIGGYINITVDRISKAPVL